MKNESLKYPFEVKYKRVLDKFDIAYWEEGEGNNTILFVHGLGSYSYAWIKTIPVLSKYFRCVSIDLPGFGKSSVIDHDATIDFYAGIIFEFLKESGISTISLCGHSMGGAVVEHFSKKHPKFVEKLILIAPAGLEKFEPVEVVEILEFFKPELMLKTTPEQVRKNVTTHFLTLPPESEKMIQDRIDFRAEPCFSTHALIITKSVSGILKSQIFNEHFEVKIPVLLIFGANDGLIPNRYYHKDLNTEILANESVSKYPDAKLILIDNCGHFPQIEKDLEVNNSIIEFVSKNSEAI